jgi:hypothetical protein
MPDVDLKSTSGILFYSLAIENRQSKFEILTGA